MTEIGFLLLIAGLFVGHRADPILRPHLNMAGLLMFFFGAGLGFAGVVAAVFRAMP